MSEMWTESVLVSILASILIESILVEGILTMMYTWLGAWLMIFALVCQHRDNLSDRQQ